MPQNPSDTIDYTATPFWQWDSVPLPDGTVQLDVPYDSIFHPREATDTVFRKSLFQRHSLQVQHTGTTLRPDTAEPAWTFVALILLTALICLYGKLRKIHPLALLKSLTSRRALDRLVRDCNLNRSIIMLPMGLLLVAAACLPVHRMALQHTGILGFLLLTLAVSLLYLLRNAIFRLLGNTFENKPAVSLYITNNYLFHLLEATVVTLLLFPFFYMPGARTAFLFAIGTFLALAFVIRFARGVKVFLTLKNNASFYLFYYLCIVEIIPILAIIKWFIVQ
ncbi:MAG: DUF4271 domain-containing protein [Bacteroidales bacterium]|nr:DUF4271 domain-containing protein [Bacteroidales bacterium]